MATNLAHFNDGIVSMDRGIRLRIAKGLIRWFRRSTAIGDIVTSFHEVAG